MERLGSRRKSSSSAEFNCPNCASEATASRRPKVGSPYVAIKASGNDPVASQLAAQGGRSDRSPSPRRPTRVPFLNKINGAVAAVKAAVSGKAAAASSVRVDGPDISPICVADHPSSSVQAFLRALTDEAGLSPNAVAAVQEHLQILPERYFQAVLMIPELLVHMRLIAEAGNGPSGLLAVHVEPFDYRAAAVASCAAVAADLEGDLGSGVAGRGDKDGADCSVAFSLHLDTSRDDSLYTVGLDTCQIGSAFTADSSASGESPSRSISASSSMDSTSGIHLAFSASAVSQKLSVAFAFGGFPFLCRHGFALALQRLGLHLLTVDVFQTIHGMSLGMAVADAVELGVSEKSVKDSLLWVAGRGSDLSPSAQVRQKKIFDVPSRVDVSWLLRKAFTMPRQSRPFMSMPFMQSMDDLLWPRSESAPSKALDKAASSAMELLLPGFEDSSLGGLRSAGGSSWSGGSGGSRSSSDGAKWREGVMCMMRGSERVTKGTEEEVKRLNRESVRTVKFLLSGGGGTSMSADVDRWALDISKLRIFGLLGSGSSGEVFKGQYGSMTVAVKVLKTSAQNSLSGKAVNKNLHTKAVVEFRREVLALMSCEQCVHVLPLYGMFADPEEGRLCIVTKFMAGGTVAEHLTQRRIAGSHGLELLKLLRIARDSIRGILFLHQHGIIHRDLKSANIFLDEYGNAVIGDLGVVRLRGERGEMTKEVGTYRWMAPEAFATSAWTVTSKCDIYSFSIFMWEMLTGGLPYADFSPLQAAVGVALNGLRPQIPGSCPPRLRALIQNCWAKDPSVRPSCPEILLELEGMLAECVGDRGERESSSIGA